MEIDQTQTKILVKPHEKLKKLLHPKITITLPATDPLLGLTPLTLSPKNDHFPTQGRKITVNGNQDSDQNIFFWSKIFSQKFRLTPYLQPFLLWWVQSEY